MPKKGYGEARSRWQAVVGSEVAAKHVVSMLHPLTEWNISQSSKLLVVPEDIIVPDVPGGKYLIPFTWIYVAHNEYNTTHDVRKRIGNHFRRRDHYLTYDLQLLHAWPWTRLECEKHDNCCGTSAHRNSTPTRPCECMLRDQAAEALASSRLESSGFVNAQ